MNTRQTGMAFQNWCEKFLIKKGYIVHNQKSVATQITTKEGKQIWVSKRNDLFGCYDLIAIDPDGDILFIAATCSSDWKKDIKKMEKILERHTEHWSDCAVYNEPAFPKGECDCGGYKEGFDVEIWQKIESGRVKVFKYKWDLRHEFELAYEIQRGKILRYEEVE